jgi:hypothetical protein
MKTIIKEKAIQFRIEGMAIGKISELLGVSKSTISLWVRKVSLSVEQKQQLLKRTGPTFQRDLSRSNAFKNRRIEYQNKGRKRVYEEDPLYLAGCMLYWGEGAKNRNFVRLTNANPAMLILFKNFLKKFFEVKDEDFAFTINCYTDLHTLKEIESYWVKTLELSYDNLRKGQTNVLPKSSKNTKINKSEWGTVALLVYKTNVVQEIYGAIQQYASFENLSWLD